MPTVIKNKLKDARHQLGIDTKKEMAARLGMTQQKYGQLEENRIQVSFKRALAISNELGLTVNELFYLSEE